MKLKLIAPARKPEWGNYDFFTMKQLANIMGKATGGMSLSLPTLAALTPDNIEVAIIDENIEPIHFDSDVDLVGISFLSSLAPRAYEISQRFREMGVPVVLGGIHASLFYGEASRFADSIVIGEAEDIWGRLISDFKKKSLKRVYHAETFPNLENLVIPRWDLMKLDRYTSFSIQTGRGCPYGCDFCSVRMFNGSRFRHKPIENILEELKFLQKLDSKKPVFFADDNLLAVPSYARELLISIEPLKLRNWFCQTSVSRLKNEELVDLLRKAGCSIVFVGLESVSQASLQSMGKTKTNVAKDYENIIDHVQRSGVAVFGSFMLGTDSDSTSVFKETADFINRTNLPYVMVNFLTPTPGSKLYERLESQDRLITKDWRKYNGESVCFQPKGMTAEKLEEGRAWLLNEIYSYGAMYKRLKSLWAKGCLLRRGKRRKLFTRGRILLTINALLSADLKRSIFVLRSLWNRKVTSVGFVSIALACHDYADELSTLRGESKRTLFFRRRAAETK